MLTADILFDLSRFEHALLFQDNQPVWSALKDLKRYIEEFSCPEATFRELAEPICRQCQDFESRDKYSCLKLLLYFAWQL